MSQEQEQSVPPNGGTARKGLARIPEAAAFLGVSKPTLYKLIQAKEVPTRRFGRCLRIPWSWLEAQDSVDADDATAADREWQAG